MCSLFLVKLAIYIIELSDNLTVWSRNAHCHWLVWDSRLWLSDSDSAFQCLLSHNDKDMTIRNTNCRQEEEKNFPFYISFILLNFLCRFFTIVKMLKICFTFHFSSLKRRWKSRESKTWLQMLETALQRSCPSLEWLPMASCRVESVISERFERRANWIEWHELTPLSVFFVWYLYYYFIIISMDR